MRRRITAMVAIISTAIVASFVIPLLILVRTSAEDRGMSLARQQASLVATTAAGLQENPKLAQLLAPTIAGSAAKTSVVLADKTVVGAAWPSVATDPDYLRAAAGEAFSVRDAAGGRAYAPVIVESGVFVVRATMTDAQLNAGVSLAWGIIIALGLVLCAVAIGVASLAGRSISQPLVAVTATAHRLREGDLAARAPLAGTSETVELGAALNGLANRIEQLLAAERDNVAGLAHRLRTPVTALRLEAEQVSDPQSAAALTGSIGELQDAIDDVVRRARQPLREDLPGGCDARAVVAERIAFWTPLAEDQGRALNVRLPAGRLPVPLSALALGDAVDIGIDNVFAHTPEGTSFAVELTAEATQILLTITDSGPGPVSEEPEPRRGTSGQGLRILQRLVADVGGHAEAAPVPQGGFRVQISLPRTSLG
ncbi:signal transduction histidine kinase [Propionicimonas paludicola]|uniref:histidine kinase n=1 Tax=Propionicimonas paludicola TaxID=185243 RepID=A0A2A9CTY9_9ACTN|nr:HAMP domain-containing sensor histidine kinase [Propionicimonas paludicola]PFG17586.1 signal transduction histidine kinase [Propionicimonas paludicola]